MIFQKSLISSIFSAELRIVKIMKNRGLLLLLILLVKSVVAQQVLIDSLTRELSTAKEDTSKVKLLGELAKSFYLFKPDTAIMLAQQAYTLSQKITYPQGE